MEHPQKPQRLKVHVSDTGDGQNSISINGVEIEKVTEFQIHFADVDMRNVEVTLKFDILAEDLDMDFIEKGYKIPPVTV